MVKELDCHIETLGIYVYYSGCSETIVWSNLKALNILHRINNEIELTSEYLKRLSEVDLLSVQPLTDIKDVVVNRKLKGAERIIDYVNQIGNPYCFLSNGIRVKLAFEGDRSLTECIKSSISIL